MTLFSGERQVSDTLDGIRGDHLERYLFAAERLSGKRVLDAGCGCGYGSALLADTFCEVWAIDHDAQSIEYAKKHWNRIPIRWECRDLTDWQSDREIWLSEAIVCFELIEHVEKPVDVLKFLANIAPTLMISTPNQDVVPKRPDNFKFHKQHWTPKGFENLLESAGWKVREWHGQTDTDQGTITRGTDEKRTIIAICDR